MRSPRVLKAFWTFFLVTVGLLLIVLAFTSDFSLAKHFEGSVWLYVSVALMALVSEYVDSSLGMGYGTTLTPVLIIMGYQPLFVVPAVLLSEFVTGISSGLLHHNQGNVDLGRGTRARKTAMILAVCSLVGTVIAVFAAVSLPKTIVKSYIGLMILGIGIFILLTRGKTGRFSFKKIIGLGGVAAFNKGISGGGYGPLVTGGQVAFGVPEKSAVGITSLAEGLVCATGLFLYFIMNKGMAWGLALPLMIGALLSVPAAVWTVKLMPPKMLRQSIGYATIFLGVLTIVRVVL